MLIKETGPRLQTENTKHCISNMVSQAFWSCCYIHVVHLIFLSHWVCATMISSTLKTLIPFNRTIEATLTHIRVHSTENINATVTNLQRTTTKPTKTFHRAPQRYSPATLTTAP
jgi:hypothetical protein